MGNNEVSISRRHPNSERYSEDALLVEKLEHVFDVIGPGMGLSFDVFQEVHRTRQVLVTAKNKEIWEYTYPELEYRVVRGLSVPIVVVAPYTVSDSLQIRQMDGDVPGFTIEAYSDRLEQHRIEIVQTPINEEPEFGFTQNPGYSMEYHYQQKNSDNSYTSVQQLGRFASLDEYGLIDCAVKEEPSYSAIVVFVDMVARKDDVRYSSNTIEFTGFAYADDPEAYRESLIVFEDLYKTFNLMPPELIHNANSLLWRNAHHVEPGSKAQNGIQKLVHAVTDVEMPSAEVVSSPEIAAVEAPDILDVPLSELVDVIPGLETEDLQPHEEPIPVNMIHLKRARHKFEAARTEVLAHSHAG